MAKVNVPVPSIKTHEGGTAKRIGPELQLRRSVMACLLWEDTFYESGEDIATRIKNIIPQVAPTIVAGIAIEAREKMKLRHVPLLIVREMAQHKEHKALVSETLSRVIQRADELAEFLAIYWKEKKQPLSAQVKKGLAKAFTKFSAYDLAKYNREGAVKLRDALFLCHAKPKDEEQAAIWKKLVDGTLESPDTWEVELSAGKNKKETWTRLMAEKKLGALAFLRNLRNMQKVDVDRTLMREYFKSLKVERVLPYRFIAAARFVPDLEPELETAMFKAIEGAEKLPGRTILLVDVSGSMRDSLSSKSDMIRLDAACGLAILGRELCEDIGVYTFANEI
ncbi:MAG TPA: TROVE domain-containing protein, partial [Candidatus Hodarchaeales archaeon]|nr:TROVE domain-containing protein [Candidatus Hodarchaeales archaeon]